MTVLDAGSVVRGRTILDPRCRGAAYQPSPFIIAGVRRAVQGSETTKIEINTVSFPWNPFFPFGSPHAEWSTLCHADIQKIVRPVDAMRPVNLINAVIFSAVE